MKATGIVRRIDDLGRVVIPKEIRRAMKIREGDPLEIFLNDGAVCFKKYDTRVSGELFAIGHSLIDEGHEKLGLAVLEVCAQCREQEEKDAE